MLNIKLSGTCTDTTLPTLRRDAVLNGDNGGVLFLFDTANTFSYSGGAPANNAVIKDIAEKGQDGRFALTAGQSVAFNGNGFDFTGVTASGVFVEKPATVAASIWGGGTGPQYFLDVLYVRLPALADWFTAAGIAPFEVYTTAAGGYTAEADLLTIAQVGPTNQLIASRQTNGASVRDALQITPGGSDYGAFAQLAFWRNAAGQGFRLKTVANASSPVLATAAVGVKNTGDFSAKKGIIGAGPSFFSGSQPNSRKWRVYRGFTENLVVSGRDPVTVLNADWDRTVARGVFS